MAPRYCIGIDLGTTNTVLSWVDLKQPEKGSQVLKVRQWERAATLVTDAALPSFAWLPPAGERSSYAAENMADNQGWVAGIAAREQMAQYPGRVVHSAKSWLCHSGVDRMEAILPWQSQDLPTDDKQSPVSASALYLRQLREQWQREMTAGGIDADFRQQQIVITVPASFDEAAQQLTMLAAREAGYPESIRLLEEPQAAFYFWLGKDSNLSILHDLLTANGGEQVRVLVCDIGGGTTDLSLFAIKKDAAAPGGLAMERLQVSDHLLLGGDNIDLTLAHILEQRLTGGKKKLTGRQWGQLLAQARQLKERILGSEESLPDNSDEEFPITLSGTGSGLFASTLTTRISAGDVHTCVLEGFFPLCSGQERPLTRKGGLKEWGLPYADDSAISRHLAGFLDGTAIDAVLFNGGTVTPLLLRQRLHQLLASWQGKEVRVLHNEAISFAVGRGAARYAQILHQPTPGSRIAGGHAHAIYLEVAKGRKREPTLICLLARGTEAGQTVHIAQREFDLLVNQPSRFQCYYSSRRKEDRPGMTVVYNRKEFQPLPELQTAIHLPAGAPRPANNRMRVTLEARLNELGLLQIHCLEKDGEGRWRLDFNLRKGVEGEPELTDPTSAAEFQADRKAMDALGLIRSVYGKKKDPQLPEIKAKELIRAVEKKLGDREQWNSLTLRTLWPELAAGMTRKSRSVQHEAAWLYLAGFVLRPGYGVQLDESRMEELWRLENLGLSFVKEPRAQSHYYLLWRRVTGGLNTTRQQKLLKKILPTLRSASEPIPEMIYLAGALERIAPEQKVELIHLFTSRLFKEKVRHKAPYFWALGRLLSRTPLYGGMDGIVHPREVEGLFAKSVEKNWREGDWRGFPALFAQAARCTEQRDIDVAPDVRKNIVTHMRKHKASPEQIKVVDQFVAVTDADRTLQFGEALPTGLILV